MSDDPKKYQERKPAGVSAKVMLSDYDCSYRIELYLYWSALSPAKRTEQNLKNFNNTRTEGRLRFAGARLLTRPDLVDRLVGAVDYFRKAVYQNKKLERTELSNIFKYPLSIVDDAQKQKISLGIGTVPRFVILGVTGDMAKNAILTAETALQAGPADKKNLSSSSSISQQPAVSRSTSSPTSTTVDRENPVSSSSSSSSDPLSNPAGETAGLPGWLKEVSKTENSEIRNYCVDIVYPRKSSDAKPVMDLERLKEINGASKTPLHQRFSTPAQAVAFINSFKELHRLYSEMNNSASISLRGEAEFILANPTDCLMEMVEKGVEIEVSLFKFFLALGADRHKILQEFTKHRQEAAKSAFLAVAREAGVNLEEAKSQPNNSSSHTTTTDVGSLDAQLDRLMAESRGDDVLSSNPISLTDTASSSGAKLPVTTSSTQSSSSLSKLLSPAVRETKPAKKPVESKTEEGLGLGTFPEDPDEDSDSHVHSRSGSPASGDETNGRRTDHADSDIESKSEGEGEKPAAVDFLTSDTLPSSSSTTTTSTLSSSSSSMSVDNPAVNPADRLAGGHPLPKKLPKNGRRGSDASSHSSSVVVPYAAGEVQSFDSKREAATLPSVSHRVSKYNKDLAISNAVWELEQGVKKGDDKAVTAVTKALSILEDAWKNLAKPGYDPLSTFLNTYRVNTDGDLLIHKAVETGNLAIIEALLQKKAQINVFNTHGESPIFNVVAAGQMNILKAIKAQLSEEALQNCLTPKNASGSSLLHIAARYGHVEAFNFLLENAAFNIADINKSGDTALHLAVKYNHTVIAAHLLNSTTNVDAANNDKETLLHFAAANGNVDLIQLLLSKDAGVTLRDRYGNSALRLAAKNGHGEVVSLLLAQPDVSRFDNNGEYGSLIHLAAAACSLGAVEALYSPGFNLCGVDKDGNTPLHLAIKNGSLSDTQVATFLCEKEPKALFILNKEGKTPLHLAIEKGIPVYFNHLWKKLSKDEKKQVSVVLYEFAKAQPKDKQTSNASVIKAIRKSRPAGARLKPSSYRSPKLLQQPREEASSKRESLSSVSTSAPRITYPRETKLTSPEPALVDSAEDTSLAVSSVVSSQFEVHKNAVQAIIEGYGKDISDALRAHEFMYFLSLCYQLMREIGDHKQFQGKEPKELVTRGAWQDKDSKDIQYVLACWNAAQERVKGSLEKSSMNAPTQVWRSGIQQIFRATAAISELLSPPEGNATQVSIEDNDPLLTTFMQILSVLWSEFDKVQFPLTGEKLGKEVLDEFGEEEVGDRAAADKKNDQLRQHFTHVMIEAPSLDLNNYPASFLPIAGANAITSPPKQKQIAATAFNRADPKHSSSSSSSTLTTSPVSGSRPVMSQSRTESKATNFDADFAASLFFGDDNPIDSQPAAGTRDEKSPKPTSDAKSPQPTSRPKSTAPAPTLHHQAAAAFGLVIQPIPGYGNCLFDAVVDQLRQERFGYNGIGLTGDHLRAIAMVQMLRHPARYVDRLVADFVGEDGRLRKKDYDLFQIDEGALNAIFNTDDYRDLIEPNAWVEALSLSGKPGIKAKFELLSRVVDEMDHSNLREDLAKLIIPLHVKRMLSRIFTGERDQNGQLIQVREWADSADVQALSDALGIPVLAIDATMGSLPYYDQNSGQPVAIIFSGNHYESLRGNLSPLQRGVAAGQYALQQHLDPLAESQPWTKAQLQQLAQQKTVADIQNVFATVRPAQTAEEDAEIQQAIAASLESKYQPAQPYSSVRNRGAAPVAGGREGEVKLGRAAAGDAKRNAPLPVRLPPLTHTARGERKIDERKVGVGAPERKVDTSAPASMPLYSSSSSSTSADRTSPIPQVRLESGILDREFKQPEFAIVHVEKPAQVKNTLEERVKELEVRQAKLNRSRYKLYKHFLEGARSAIKLEKYLNVEVSKDLSRDSSIISRHLEASKINPLLEQTCKGLTEILESCLGQGGIQASNKSLLDHCQAVIDRLPNKPRQRNITIEKMRTLLTLLDDPSLESNMNIKDRLEKLKEAWGKEFAQEIENVEQETDALEADWAKLINGEKDKIGLVQAAQADDLALRDFSKNALKNVVYPVVQPVPGDNQQISFATRSRATVDRIKQSVRTANDIEAIRHRGRTESQYHEPKTAPPVLATVENFRKSMPEKVWRELGIDTLVVASEVETKGSRSTPEPNIERKTPAESPVPPTPEPREMIERKDGSRPLSPETLAREQKLTAEQINIKSYLDDLTNAEGLSLPVRVAALQKEQLKADLQQYEILKKILEAAIPVVEAAANTPAEVVSKTTEREEAKLKYKGVVGPCRTLADSIDDLSALANKLQHAGKISAGEGKSVQELKAKFAAAAVANGQSKESYSHKAALKAQNNLKKAIKKLRDDFPVPKGTNPFQPLRPDLEQILVRQKMLAEVWNKVGSELSDVIEKTTSPTQCADYARLLNEQVIGSARIAVHKSRELITHITGNPAPADSTVASIDEAQDALRSRMREGKKWKPAYRVGAAEAELAAKLEPAELKAEQAVHTARVTAAESAKLSSRVALRTAELELIVIRCDHQQQLKGLRVPLFEQQEDSLRSEVLGRGATASAELREELQQLQQLGDVTEAAKQELDQATAALALARANLAAFAAKQKLPARVHAEARKKAILHLQQALETPPMSVEKLQGVVAIPGILASAANAPTDFRIEESKELPITAGNMLAALFNDDRLHTFLREFPVELEEIGDFLAHAKGKTISPDIAKRYQKWAPLLQKFADWLVACWAVVDYQEGTFQKLLQQAGLEQIAQELLRQLNALQTAVDGRVVAPAVFKTITDLLPLTPVTPAQSVVASEESKPRRFEPAFITKKPNARGLLSLLSHAPNEKAFQQLLENIEDYHELTGEDLAAVLALTLSEKNAKVIAGLVGMAMVDPTLQPALLNPALWLGARPPVQVPITLFLKAVQTNNVELVKQFIPLIKASGTNQRDITDFLKQGLESAAGTINSGMQAYLKLEQAVNQAIYSDTDIGPQESKSSQELSAFFGHDATLSRDTFQRAYAIAAKKPNLFQLLLSNLNDEDLAAEVAPDEAKSNPLYALLKKEVTKRETIPSSAPLAGADRSRSFKPNWYIVTPETLEENFNDVLAQAKAGHPAKLEELLKRKDDLQGSRIHFLMTRARLELEANAIAEHKGVMPADHKAIVELFDNSGIRPPGPLNTAEAQQLYDTIATKNPELLQTLHITPTTVPDVSKKFPARFKEFTKELKDVSKKFPARSEEFTKELIEAKLTNLDARLEDYRKAVMDRESKVINVDGVGKVRVYPHKGKTNLFLDQCHFFARGLDVARGALEIFKYAVGPGPESLTAANAAEATEVLQIMLLTFHQSINDIDPRLPQNERLELANEAYKIFEAGLVALLIHYNACGPRLDDDKANFKRATTALEMVRDFMYERTFHEEVSCTMQPAPIRADAKHTGQDWVLHVQRPVTLSRELEDNPWRYYEGSPWFHAQQKHLVAAQSYGNGHDNWLKRFTKAHWAELQTIPSTSISRATPRSGNAAHCSRVQIIQGKVGGATPVLSHTREGIVTPIFHNKTTLGIPNDLGDGLELASGLIARHNRFSNTVGYHGEILCAQLEAALNSGIPPEQLRSVWHHTLISFFTGSEDYKKNEFIYHSAKGREDGNIQTTHWALGDWLKSHPVFYTIVDNAPVVAGADGVERKDSKSVPAMAATPRYKVVIASSPEEAKRLEGSGAHTRLNLVSQTSNDAVNVWGAGALKLAKKRIEVDLGSVDQLENLACRLIQPVLQRELTTLLASPHCVACVYHELAQPIQDILQKITNYSEQHVVKKWKEMVDEAIGADDLVPVIEKILLSQPRKKLEKLEKALASLVVEKDNEAGQKEITDGLFYLNGQQAYYYTTFLRTIRHVLSPAPESKAIDDHEKKKELVRTQVSLALRAEKGPDSISALFDAILKLEPQKMQLGFNPGPVYPGRLSRTAIAALQQIVPRSQELLLLQAVAQLRKAKNKEFTGSVRPSVQTAVATEIVARLTGISVGGCMSSCDRAPDIDAAVNYNLMAFERWGKIVSYDNSIQIISSKDGTLILEHTDPVTKQKDRLVVEGPTVVAHNNNPGWITKPDELLGRGWIAPISLAVSSGPDSGLPAANELSSERDISLGYSSLRNVKPKADIVKKALTQLMQVKENKESRPGQEKLRILQEEKAKSSSSSRPVVTYEEMQIELADFLREDKAANEVIETKAHSEPVAPTIAASETMAPPVEMSATGAADKKSEEPEEPVEREEHEAEPAYDEPDTDLDEEEAAIEKLPTDDKHREMKEHKASPNVMEMDPSLYDEEAANVAEPPFDPSRPPEERTNANIFEAAAAGNKPRVQKLIESKLAGLDDRDDHGRTPLMYAAAHAVAYKDGPTGDEIHKQADVIDYLIEQGANVTEKHNSDSSVSADRGYSALTYAAGQGHPSAVLALCCEPDDKSKFRPEAIYLFNLPDKWNCTPLIHAIAGGYRARNNRDREKDYCDTITELLGIANAFPAEANWGVDNTITNALRYTVACKEPSDGILDALCAGVTVEHLITALHDAVRFGNVSMVKAIVRAEPWARPASGYSREEFLQPALTRAKTDPSKRVITTLLQEALDILPLSLNEAAARGDLAAVQRFADPAHPEYKQTRAARRAAAHEALAYAAVAAYDLQKNDTAGSTIQRQEFEWGEGQGEVIDYLIENENHNALQSPFENEWLRAPDAEAPGYDALRRAAAAGNTGAVGVLLRRIDDNQVRGDQAAAMLVYGQPVTAQHDRNNNAYALTYAVQGGNPDAVQAILSALKDLSDTGRLDPEQFQNVLTDALRYAAYHHQGMIGALCDPTYVSGDKLDNALAKAIALDDAPTVIELLKRPELPSTPHAVLLIAIRQGSAEVITQIIATHHIAPNMRDAEGNTLLMLAARAGHLESVRALLTAAGPQNTEEALAARTALAQACRDPNLPRSPENPDAMTLAYVNGNRAIVNYLRINYQIPEPEFLQQDIHTAAHHGNVEQVRRCLDADAQALNRLDEANKYTPLMYAAAQGHVNVVTDLTGRADIRPDAKTLPIPARGDGGKHTALMLAARNGHVDVLRRLLYQQAVGLELDPEGQLPEAGALALEELRPEAIRLLQQHDANGTALMQAVKAGRADVVTYLLGVYAEILRRDISVADRDALNANLQQTAGFIAGHRGQNDADRAAFEEVCARFYNFCPDLFSLTDLVRAATAKNNWVLVEAILTGEVAIPVANNDPQALARFNNLCEVVLQEAAIHGCPGALQTVASVIRGLPLWPNENAVSNQLREYIQAPRDGNLPEGAGNPNALQLAVSHHRHGQVAEEFRREVGISSLTLNQAARAGNVGIVRECFENPLNRHHVADLAQRRAAALAALEHAAMGNGNGADGGPNHVAVVNKLLSRYALFGAVPAGQVAGYNALARAISAANLNVITELLRWNRLPNNNPLNASHHNVAVRRILTHGQPRPTGGAPAVPYALTLAVKVGNADAVRTIITALNQAFPAPVNPAAPTADERTFQQTRQIRIWDALRYAAHLPAAGAEQAQQEQRRALQLALLTTARPHDIGAALELAARQGDRQLVNMLERFICEAWPQAADPNAIPPAPPLELLPLRDVNPNYFLRAYVEAAGTGQPELLDAVGRVISARGTPLTAEYLERALCLAAERGHYNIVTGIIRRYYEHPEVQFAPVIPGHLSQALAAAIENGHPEVVKFLLDYNAPLPDEDVQCPANLPHADNVNRILAVYHNNKARREALARELDPWAEQRQEAGAAVAAGRTIPALAPHLHINAPRLDAAGEALPDDQQLQFNPTIIDDEGFIIPAEAKVAAAEALADRLLPAVDEQLRQAAFDEELDRTIRPEAARLIAAAQLRLQDVQAAGGDVAAAQGRLNELTGWQTAINGQAPNARYNGAWRIMDAARQSYEAERDAATANADAAAEAAANTIQQDWDSLGLGGNLLPLQEAVLNAAQRTANGYLANSPEAVAAQGLVTAIRGAFAAEEELTEQDIRRIVDGVHNDIHGDAVADGEAILDAIDAVRNAAINAISSVAADPSALEKLRDEAVSAERWRSAKKVGIGLGVVLTAGGVAAATAMGQGPANLLDAMGGRGQDLMKAYGWGTGTAKIAGAATLSELMQKAQDNSPYHQSPLVRVFTAKRILDETIQGLGRTHAKESLLDLNTVNGLDADHRPTEVRAALIELIEARLYYSMLWRKKHPTPAGAVDADREERLLPEQAVYVLSQLREKLKGNEALTAQELQQVKMTYNTVLAIRDPDETTEKNIGKRSARWFGAGMLVSLLGAVAFIYGLDPDNKLMNQLRQWVDDGVPNVEGTGQDIAERNAKVESFVMAILSVVPAIAMGVAWLMISRAFVRNCKTYEDFKRADETLSRIRSGIQRKDREGFDYNQKINNITTASWQDWKNFCAPPSLPPAGQRDIGDGALYIIRGIGGAVLAVVSALVVPVAYMLAAIGSNKNLGADWVPTGGTFFAPKSVHGLKRALWYATIVFPVLNAALWITRGLVKLAFYLPARVLQHVYQAVFLTVPDNAPQFVKDYYNTGRHKGRGPFGYIFDYLWEVTKRLVLGGNYLESTNQHQHFSAQNTAISMPVKQGSGFWYGLGYYARNIHRVAGRFFLGIGAVVLNALPKSWKPSSWSKSEKLTIGYNFAAIVVGVLLVLFATAVVGAVLASPLTAAIIGVGVFGSLANIFASAIIVGISILLPRIWKFLKNSFSNKLREDALRVQENVLPVADQVPSVTLAAPAEVQDLVPLPEPAAANDAEPENQPVLAPLALLGPENREPVVNLGPAPEVAAGRRLIAAPPLADLALSQPLLIEKNELSAELRDHISLPPVPDIYGDIFEPEIQTPETHEFGMGTAEMRRKPSDAGSDSGNVSRATSPAVSLTRTTEHEMGASSIYGEGSSTRVPVVQTQAPQQPTERDVATRVPAVQTRAPQPPAEHDVATRVPAVQTRAPQPPVERDVATKVPVVQTRAPQQPTERDVATKVPVVQTLASQQPTDVDTSITHRGPVEVKTTPTSGSSILNLKASANARRTYDHMIEFARRLNLFINVGIKDQYWKGEGKGHAFIWGRVEGTSNKQLGIIDRAFPNKKPAMSKVGNALKAHDHRYQVVLTQLIDDYANIIRDNKPAAAEAAALDKWYKLAQEAMYALCEAANVTASDYFANAEKPRAGGIFENKSATEAERQAVAARQEAERRVVAARQEAEKQEAEKQAVAEGQATLSPSSFTSMTAKLHAKSVVRQPVEDTKETPLPLPRQPAGRFPVGAAPTFFREEPVAPPVEPPHLQEEPVAPPVEPPLHPAIPGEEHVADEELGVDMQDAFGHIAPEEEGEELAEGPNHDGDPSAPRGPSR